MAEIPNLGDRLRTLGAPGWIGRDAEWLALVCLYGGVFLQPQYLTFLGRSHPELVPPLCAAVRQHGGR